jgi:hypothetical protein
MTSMLRPFVLFPLALTAVAVAPQGTAPGVPAPPTATASTRLPDLRSDFERSYKVGDRAGMTKLVRDNSADAASWLYELAMALKAKPDEEQEKLYEAVGRAWSEAFSTGFSDRVRGFADRLEDAERSAYSKLKTDYFTLTTSFFARRAEPVTPERASALQTIAEQLETVAQSLWDLGDGYFASRAWMYVGDAYNASTVGAESGKPARELEAQKKALAACDSMDIGDRAHRECRTRVTHLEAVVARGESGGGEAKGAASSKLPFEFGAAAKVKGTGQELPELKKSPRLSYGWDEVHPTWPQVQIADVGQTTNLTGMIDGPTIERQGLNEIVVTDAEGNATRVKLSLEATLVSTRVGRGAAAVPYAFAIKLGNTNDEFQGFAANLATTPANMTMYLRPAAAVVIDVGGTPVHVLDDNLDGIFGGPPTGVSFAGLPAGATQPALDAVFVGKSKTPQPFSELMAVGKQWYRFSSADNGRTFEVAPATTIALGTAKLAFDGAELEWLVVRGKGALEKVFVRLEPGKPVELPVGEYELFSGVVRDGDAKALMLAGDSEAFAVTAAARTDVTFGAPFTFEFSSADTTEGIKVKGASVSVVGAGGEHYGRYWRCQPRPEVHLRKDDASSWSKVGQLQVIDDIDELGEHGGEGWNMVWWPLDGLFENKLGDGAQVRLFEKKNPLFGKIDSAPVQ